MTSNLPDLEKVDLEGAKWRKASYTQNSGNCVEVADGYTGVMPVRDSKDPEGPALVFRSEAWAGFVKGIKAGDFPIDV
jgi:hypothetical protein